MPEQPKAASTIVHPQPATAEAIWHVAEAFRLAARMGGLVENGDTGDAFLAGITLGLTIAIDNPAAVQPILSAVDGRMKVDMNASDDDHAANLEARAESAQVIANAALGVSELPQPPGWNDDSRWN
jgi:hypothetical protein